MARPFPVVSMVTLLGLSASSCDTLLGRVDVSPAPVSAPPPDAIGPTPPPAPGPAGARPPPAPPPRGTAVESPVGGPLLGGIEPRADAGTDAGAPEDDPGPDAAPPPPPLPLPRPVVVEEPLVELERVGVDGGDPRLATCEGGVIIGVRPTANPSEDVFGQRVTFVEPICGTLTHDPARLLEDPGALSVTSTEDASILDWEDSDPFFGPPLTEVPDARLIWELQPPTLCPAAAPVLVGLSGQYDPEAPDAADTAVIRSLTIECAPLRVADNGVDIVATGAGRQLLSRPDSFAADGDENYSSSCEDGSVTTRIQISAGYWLDGFVLGCSRLLSPNLAGEPCSTDRGCQSDECLADGVCAP